MKFNQYELGFFAVGNSASDVDNGYQKVNSKYFEIIARDFNPTLEKKV